MDAVVAPILRSQLDASGFIQACQAMNLPNPVSEADRQGLHGMKHTIASLDSVQNKPFLTGNILHLGYLIVASWEDMPEVLAYAGMPHLYHDAAVRFPCVVVVGSINQWLDSCKRACTPETSHTVRYVFNKIYIDLQKHMVLDGHRSDNGDGTFLIEDLR